MQHPWGIEPWGNFIMRGGPDIRNAGLGDFSVLSDGLLLELLGVLEAKELGRLALVSKALYCFANQEELWKGLVIEEYGGQFQWAGCWQQSYLVTKGWQVDAVQAGHGSEGGVGITRSAKRHKSIGGKAAAKKLCAVHAVRRVGGMDSRLITAPWGKKYLAVRGFYSDLLYQPWFCATTDILQEWLHLDNIDRRSGLTVGEFREQYELRNRPVILTDVMASWPAIRRWNRAYIAAQFKGQDAIVGNMPMAFSTYAAYSDSNFDEMPLYLFDKRFALRAPQLANDYDVPAHFAEDLFSVLGDARPDYRWLIMGPARSGSSFHIDPNATSAWNALVWGAKKWVMYPPGVVPPGVHPSVDGADVATPLSLMEWFINFYAATKETKVRPIEFVARPGELLFVPRGWWHCALNLEDSCAITQNYVSSVGLGHVLAFLKPGRADLVSGCAQDERSDLHDRFLSALKQQRPEVLVDLEARQVAARDRARQSNALAVLFKTDGHTTGPTTAGNYVLTPTTTTNSCQEAATTDSKRDAAPTTCSVNGSGGFSFGFRLSA